MKKNSKIFIAGGSGMVGSAILRSLKKRNYNNILYPNSLKLNLTSQFNTDEINSIIDCLD